MRTLTLRLKGGRRKGAQHLHGIAAVSHKEESASAGLWYGIRVGAMSWGAKHASPPRFSMGRAESSNFRISDWNSGTISVRVARQCIESGLRYIAERGDLVGHAQCHLEDTRRPNRYPKRQGFPILPRCQLACLGPEKRLISKDPLEPAEGIHHLFPAYGVEAALLFIIATRRAAPCADNGHLGRQSWGRASAMSSTGLGNMAPRPVLEKPPFEWRCIVIVTESSAIRSFSAMVSAAEASGKSYRAFPSAPLHLGGALFSQ